MLWIFIIILSYVILAAVLLIDKHILTEKIPDPKIYAFWAGFLGILVFVLAPFVDFYVPVFPQLVLAIFTGMTAIFALFYFYQTLKIFESSRVAPAIGAIMPFFSLGLIYVFSGGKEVLPFSRFPAFFLLILGTFLINFRGIKKISFSGLKLSFFTAFFFAIDVVLTKYVYLSQSFWNGFIWINLGGFLMALFFFLSSSKIREDILENKIIFQRGKNFIFFLGKILGGAAGLLQNLAVFLAPLDHLPLINALQGIEYVFLLVFAVFLSRKFPEILKENISGEIVSQKILAVLIIGIGLFYLFM